MHFIRSLTVQSQSFLNNKTASLLHHAAYCRENHAETARGRGGRHRLYCKHNDDRATRTLHFQLDILYYEYILGIHSFLSILLNLVKI